MWSHASQTPALLMRAVLFLASRSIDTELGNSFVKFPGGDDCADQGRPPYIQEH